MKVGDLVQTTSKVKWQDIGIIVDIIDRAETMSRLRVRWSGGMEQNIPPSCIEVVSESR